MVKIADISFEEVKRIERASKLVKITKEVIPEAKEVSLLGVNHIAVYFDSSSKSGISVGLMFGHEIEVNDPQYFDSAYRLAEQFEKIGEPEFTVKRNYAHS